MIVWGLNKACGIRRLNIVRSILKEEKRHLLSVSQFCREEDITLATTNYNNTIILILNSI